MTSIAPPHELAGTGWQKVDDGIARFRGIGREIEHDASVTHDKGSKQLVIDGVAIVGEGERRRQQRALKAPSAKVSLPQDLEQGALGESALPT